MTRHQIASLLRRSRRRGRETLWLKVQWAPEEISTRLGRTRFVLWLQPLFDWVESETVAVFSGLTTGFVQMRKSEFVQVSCDSATGVVTVRVSVRAGRDASGLAQTVALLVQQPGEAQSVQVAREKRERHEHAEQ